MEKEPGEPQFEEEKPKETAEERIARRRTEMDKELEEAKKMIAQQEYEKVKRGMERFRKEHGIKKSEEALRREDEELRKKFGLE